MNEDGKRAIKNLGVYGLMEMEFSTNNACLGLQPSGTLFLLTAPAITICPTLSRTSQVKSVESKHKIENMRNSNYHGFLFSSEFDELNDAPQTIERKNWIPLETI